MKKVLFIIGLFLVAGYLIFALFFVKEKPNKGICTGMEVDIKNAIKGVQLIDENNIKLTIKNRGLDPTEKTFNNIDAGKIEDVVASNQLVKHVNVFITNANTLKIFIEERKPVLRVIAQGGESYYIDSDAKKMPLSKHSSVYVPIATGNIKEEFAKTDLYNFAVFLQNDSFWNSQIEQIIVLPNEDVKLIPRVGEHEIILGKLDNYKVKLDKLFSFYEEGLNKIGWNKYSAINLKYDKQVVCTRR